MRRSGLESTRLATTQSCQLWGHTHLVVVRDGEKFAGVAPTEASHDVAVPRIARVAAPDGKVHRRLRRGPARQTHARSAYCPLERWVRFEGRPRHEKEFISADRQNQVLELFGIAKNLSDPWKCLL